MSASTKVVGGIVGGLGGGFAGVALDSSDGGLTGALAFLGLLGGASLAEYFERRASRKKRDDREPVRRQEETFDDFSDDLSLHRNPFSRNVQEESSPDKLDFDN